MSDINTTLINGLNNLFSHAGISTSINIIEYNFIESDYDDERIQTQTGSNVVSGLVFPIKSSQGSSEALLLQEGKLLTNDKVLYIGSCNVSGAVVVELQNDFYTIIPDGIQTWDVNGSTVYSKMFIRKNLGGSTLF
ncbi:hypothetical protein KAI04_04770 [Candidatus Pacearchaeota archaeon]|nr:hypothetical protein [Candidatus Pacearchaeota archaeon]